MRAVCDVTVMGETHSLPLTMEAWEALSSAGLCLYRLTVLSADRGEKLVLTMEQAAHTLAVGITYADPQVTRTRPAAIKAHKWRLLMLARRKGCRELLLAATEYLAEFAAESATEAPVPPEGTKEGPAPNP